MDIFTQLLGRLHPVVVHLPIGFIITGLLLQWYDRKENHLTKIVALIFLWGFIAAAIACISGYLLYMGEGYSFDTVSFHLWFGIFTALFSFLMFLRLKETFRNEIFKGLPVMALSFLLFFLVSITGHLGGNITHGSDYLTEPLPSGIKALLGLQPEIYEMPVLQEENWEEAILYEDVVQPILESRCLSCHNSKKDKGGLQLHSQQAILKGGENGSVISANDPKNSAIFARLVLPLDHEEHMPPKDKSQLSKQEIEIIQQWIVNANSFDKSIAELGLKKELFTSFFPKNSESDYPDVEVAMAIEDSIAVLKARGLHIEAISEDNNLLKVSCTNNPTFGDEDLKSLSSILSQTVYLDLGGTQVTDDVFESLSLFPNLTILKLDKTEITGKNIDKIKDLEHLRIINLTRTDFQEEYLPVFSSFADLRKVYLYNTPLSKSNTEEIIEGVHYNFGNYELPIMETDSILY